MRKKRHVIMAASLAAMLVVNSFSGVQFTQPKSYAAASEQSTEADENGFVIKNGVLTDYTSNCTAADIIIPDTVTEIAPGALKGNTYIARVTIPSTVKEIPSFCFFGCKNLQSVILLDGVQSIGTSAFFQCDSSISVTIPKSVTSIGDNAFDLTNKERDYSIFGDKSTYAEEYANSNGIAFNPSGKCVGIKNVNVCTMTKNKKTTAPVGKGDATIINFGNKEYALVDTGEETTFASLKAGIENSCFKQSDKKYHFKAIVISHFHSDHCGALRELVKWKDIHIETVYIKDFSGYLNDIKNAKEVKDDNNNVTATQLEIQISMAKPYNHFASFVGEKAIDLTKTKKKKKLVLKGNAETGLASLYASVKDAKKKKIHSNDLKIVKIPCLGKECEEVGTTTMTIYGVATQFAHERANDSEAENNSSMIVRVVGRKADGGDFKAILLGDLLYAGLGKITNASGTEKENYSEYMKIFNSDYDYCKFGHHGLRSEKNLHSIVRECKWYKKYINAEFYVFTLDKKRWTNKNYYVADDETVKKEYQLDENKKLKITKRDCLKRNYKMIVYCLSHKFVDIEPATNETSAETFRNYVNDNIVGGKYEEEIFNIATYKDENDNVLNVDITTNFTDKKDVNFKSSSVTKEVIVGGQWKKIENKKEKKVMYGYEPWK